MYWDAKKVIPLPEYQIYVEVANGEKGIFDLKPYLNTGILKELRDVNYFNQVGIEFGAITWPHEQDIDPETLVSEMKTVGTVTKNNQPVPCSLSISRFSAFLKGFSPSFIISWITERN
jgi:hypothetical protein